MKRTEAMILVTAVATCEEQGIGFVPWGPVGMGYLTGKVHVRTRLDPKTDLRSGFDRFSSGHLAANSPILAFLEGFSEKENATPAQNRTCKRSMWS
jgi:aryl-alcohol dehydrogenase-like predicted oxidoreductase